MIFIIIKMSKFLSDINLIAKDLKAKFSLKENVILSTPQGYLSFISNLVENEK